MSVAPRMAHDTCSSPAGKSARPGRRRGVLITGGLGFIGSHLAMECLRAGETVRVLDNLSRPGGVENLARLRAAGGPALEVVRADVRDAAAVAAAAAGAEVIYHLAAQVAVTSSLQDPRGDFEVNATGTLNVLEAARSSGSRPAVVFTSTNKVYGPLGDLPLTLGGRRCHWPTCPDGIAESCPLDPQTPYACSKAAADQYVRDYYRVFGVRTVVFRMSCIYGAGQFGTEEQGWVAHLVAAAVLGREVTVCGDGRQVRDVLEVTDLVRALRLAAERIEVTAGRAYNVGGGPGRTLSLLELLDLVDGQLGRRPPLRFARRRPGDQRVYVSDIRAAGRDLGWAPAIAPGEGVERLCCWALDNRGVLERVLDGAVAAPLAVAPWSRYVAA